MSRLTSHKPFVYLAFHKPYGVVTQFSKAEENVITLADFLPDLAKNIYPVGRLDKDSEGLLILSSDPSLTDKIMNPRSKVAKAYLAQVDGQITPEAIKKLQNGVSIKHKKKPYRTKPCQAQAIPAPLLPDRDPPIRYRKNIPTSWVEIILTEGKNRQVRKMCAAAGFPVLRLIRHRIGNLKLGSLPSGQAKNIAKKDIFY